MAIDFKSSVEKLIGYFQRDRIPVGAQLHKAENPFSELGSYGEIPAPREFSGIMYARLNAHQSRAAMNPEGRTKVYENERLSIFVRNYLIAKDGLSEQMMSSYFSPMYEAMYNYMTKTQSTMDLCESISTLNKVSGSFEIFMNEDLEQ